MPFLQLMSKLCLVDDGRLAETELFTTIRSRLAPLLRPAGPGSSNDTDVAMFLDSLPGLSKSREGNLKIIDFYEKILDRNVAEMALAEKMIMDGTFTPSEFRRRTAQLGSLWTPEEEEILDRAQLGTSEQPNGSGGSTSSAQQPKPQPKP